MYDVVVKKFTFGSSSPDEFTYLNRENYVRGKMQCFTDMCIPRLL